MMNENQESSNDVLEEMHAFKNHPNAKKTVKGTFVAGILDGLACRIEAALRREAATAEKSSVVGNSAAMREALEAIRGSIAELRERNPDVVPCVRDAIDWIENWASSALSKPSRNCDRFTSIKRARTAYCSECGRIVSIWDGYESELFENWLVAPEREEKGGAE